MIRSARIFEPGARGISRILASAVVASSSWGTLSGCELLGTASDEPGPALSAARPGSAPSYRLKILSVQDCRWPPHEAVQPGSRRLGVHVELEAHSAERLPANPFYARLRDKRDRSHRPVLAGCEPELNHAPLRKGERVRGWINFVLPRDAEGLELVYAPKLGTSEEQPTSVPLGTLLR